MRLEEDVPRAVWGGGRSRPPVKGAPPPRRPAVGDRSRRGGLIRHGYTGDGRRHGRVDGELD